MHEDGSITVHGDVNLNSKGLTQIPFTFREVTGNFDCSYNLKLSSLEGAPQTVGGYFYCRTVVNLSSLEGGPKIVGRHFYCHNNPNLTSLEGAPDTIGGDFYCSNNPKLKSPKGLPKAREYFTDFSDEEIKRELYRQKLDSEMDQETKDVFGGLLADL